MSQPMYQAFVLVPGEASIEAAETAIRKTCPSSEVERAGRRILVNVRNYLFIVAIMTGDGVREESGEIARSSHAADRPDRETIASCSTRFEVWADSFDDSLIRWHDYTAIIGALEAAFPGAISYEPGIASFQSGPTRAGFLKPQAEEKKPAAKKKSIGKKKSVAKKLVGKKSVGKKSVGKKPVAKKPVAKKAKPARKASKRR